MTLIDNKENIVYECSLVEIAKRIGISTQSLWRYRKKSNFKVIGDFKVIFDKVVRIKQVKGFAIK